MLEPGVGNLHIKNCIKNLMAEMPSCSSKDNGDKTWKSSLKIEKGHFPNIANTQTAHVPFTNVFIGLIRDTEVCGVKPKMNLKNENQIWKT